ncbi:MAG: phosphoenolpyruvate--protein phosphotransferase [Gammaproteobacteria bacterium]|nr:phosphoenolpyruvate--protein phosphotransferase [Gammaproteobacteria bacterium]
MLQLLNNIIQQANEAPDLNHALRLIVNQVKHNLSVDVCSIYLMDDKTNELVLMASEGLLEQSIGIVRLRFNKGLVGLVAERAEPVNLANAHSHSRYHYFSETGEELFHAFLGVPIIQHGSVLGVLVVQHSSKRSFKEEIVKFCATLATQLSVVITHLKAIDGVKKVDKRTHKLNTNIQFTGIPSAPGIVIGTAVVIDLNLSIESIPDKTVENISDEQHRFMKAVHAVKSEIKHLLESISDSLPETYTTLFDAYLLMLESNSFIGAVNDEIKKGNWAQGALRKIMLEFIKTFSEMEDAYLKQRVEDIRDLSKRLLNVLNNNTLNSIKYRDNSILVGHELTASMLAEVPKGKLSGIISVNGSSTSHTAILASALGAAAVLGIDDLPISFIDGFTIIVNGYSGQIFINPDNKRLKEYQLLVTKDQLATKKLWDDRHLPSVSKDNVHIPIYANTGIISDIKPAISSGADGIGLYRTEFSFLESEFFPGEKEQENIYKHVIESFKPHPVTMRTLDVGGDKTLPYFPIEEDNPFLGWRGIRITLDQPEIFLVQARAMLRANIDSHNLKILIPMATSLHEIDNAIALIHQAHQEIVQEGLETPFPQIGAMIEVPSLIYQIAALSKRVDFISIGSNDLTQYLLAVDRNNARVAELYDSLHPSVIAAIYQVVSSAKKNQLPVTICGEMASDPLATILLMGMKIDSLSMNSSSMPRIKSVIRTMKCNDCEKVLSDVLQMEEAITIKEYLISVIKDKGLFGLINPGN